MRMQVGEIIYDNIPILFENESSRNEYSDRLKRITEKLLEASESKTVTEFLVKLVYGEDFCLPARLLDTKIEVHGERVLEIARMYRAIKQTLEETSPDELDVDRLGYVRAWWD